MSDTMGTLSHRHRSGESAAPRAAPRSDLRPRGYRSGVELSDGRNVNTLYRVNVATGKPTKLFELGAVDGWQRVPVFVSPDLKSVAYGTALEPSITFKEIDIGAVLPGLGGKK